MFQIETHNLALFADFVYQYFTFCICISDLCLKNPILIQVALVICGPFICKFAYSHWLHWSKNAYYLVKKWTFYLQIQYSRVHKNDGITKETCIFKSRINIKGSLFSTNFKYDNIYFCDAVHKFLESSISFAFPKRSSTFKEKIWSQSYKENLI